MLLDQAIQLADRHHRAGRPDEVGRICREVLAHRPDQPDALHLLGIVEAQAGHLDAAVDLIGRAVHVRPDFADAWANLGCALVNNRKYEQAIEAYSQLAQLRPRDATPHYALGIICRDLGRLDEAIAAFSTATRLAPDHVDAYCRLGAALRSNGRLDESIAAYSKAIERNPGLAEAHNNLANALRDKGLLDEAIIHYSRAVRLSRDDPVTHLNLGNALALKERFADALRAYQRSVQLDPDCFDAYNHMGFALAHLGRFDEALLAHRRALALRPDDPRAHETLGATLLLKQDMPSAEASFRRALVVGPDRAPVWNGLGTALGALGRFEEASACFRKALAINPDGALFYKGLVATGRQIADPAELQRLTDLLNRSDLSMDDRIAAGFALGKLLDEADRFDQAFAHFAQANSLLKQSLAGAGERFNADELHRTVDRIIENFTPEFFAQRRTWGNGSELPVFIVGMPRSGTTLVEQIAASHPDVFGAGELPDIEHLSIASAGGQERLSGKGWLPELIRSSSRTHLRHLSALGGCALRVTDKMPGNIFHLGLITTMFPGARVIFCCRDPRDNCLSCYFQHFARKLPYIYDLSDCARQYLQTARLTRHWLNVLPLRMLQVQYEELVADQEGQSRRLIDFLGLPWDPACLEFHRTQRTVVTASLWQVRQPMYTRSVARWRNYERHLGPLLDVLGLG